MDHTNKDNTEQDESFKDRHSFSLFICASLILACFIVVISMAMYNGSGAAQLDLSRPGYKDVRSQATNNGKDFQDYSSSGPINKETIVDFRIIYNNQAKKVKAVDAFGGDPLNPDVLWISSTDL